MHTHRHYYHYIASRVWYPLNTIIIIPSVRNTYTPSISREYNADAAASSAALNDLFKRLSDSDEMHWYPTNTCIHLSSGTRGGRTAVIITPFWCRAKRKIYGFCGRCVRVCVIDSCHTRAIVYMIVPALLSINGRSPTMAIIKCRARNCINSFFFFFWRKLLFLVVDKVIRSKLYSCEGGRGALKRNRWRLIAATEKYRKSWGIFCEGWYYIPLIFSFLKIIR